MPENKRKWKKLDLNSLYFLIGCIVMVVSVGIIGTILTVESVSGLRTTLWKHMDSVSTIAATLIDGDELKLITEEDYPTLDPETGRRIADGSERCTKLEKTLLEVKNAQHDMHIQYIYITRKNEKGKQVFAVDPDIDRPGEYGQEVVYTPSQPEAWAGSTAVDTKPYTDEWGRYYTAWSPVKDSSGRVVGLVGVDFDATQITEQIDHSIFIITFCSLILLIISITFFVLYSKRLDRRSKMLSKEVEDLSTSLKAVFDEIEGINTSEAIDDGGEDYSEHDFLKYIHKKTVAMTKLLHSHNDYLKQQANIDFLTKAGNTRAYAAEKDVMQKTIEEGKAAFAVAVFDINNLKSANDNYGHEVGDVLIRNAADALRKAFPRDRIYRVGGDEFAVIIPDATEKTMAIMLELLDHEIEMINKMSKISVKLSMSKGYSVFDSEKDTQYKDVFLRADQNMYAEKEKFHAENN